MLLVAGDQMRPLLHVQAPPSAPSTSPLSSGLGVAESQTQLGLPIRPESRSAGLLQRAAGAFFTRLDVVSGQEIACLSTLEVRHPFRLPSVEPHLQLVDIPPRREPELDATPYVVAIRRLIEVERVSAARRVLESVPLHVSDEPALITLRTVLAPPVVRTLNRRDTDRRPEYEWLCTEGPKYRGKWVALQGYRLLAVAPTLRELREQVKLLPLTQTPLFHRVE